MTHRFDSPKVTTAVPKLLAIPPFAKDNLLPMVESGFEILNIFGATQRLLLLLLMPPPGTWEGGAQEGERRKGQRGGSVPPPVVVPTCRPLRGRWVWQDS